MVVKEKEIGTMGEGKHFEYYYGIEAEQFSFYQIARLLIKDKRFKRLSSDAKLLYGLMLDRMSLSMKNGWLDAENRVYIHYTIENIMEDLDCAKATAVKIMSELDSKKGIGVIEKKRQGLGRPDIIYVKNFAVVEEQTGEVNDTVGSCGISEVQNLNFKKYKRKNSGGSEDETTVVQELNGNNNNNSYTEKSYINLSSHVDSNMNLRIKGITIDNEMDADLDYVQIVKENLEYDCFMQDRKWKDRALYEELFQLICDVVCVERKSIRIEGQEYPYEVVKARFLKLNSLHLLYVIQCMQNSTSKIGNIKGYMLTALYNAPNTMKHYYQQAVLSEVL